MIASCSRTGLRCWLRCLWRNGLLGRHELRLITVSVRYASAYVAQHSPSLHIPRPPVVPPPIGIDGSGAIPSLECINIMLAHLLFGGETFTELVKHQIGAHRRNAAYQHHQHPFHGYAAYVLAHPSETARDCAGSKGQLFNLPSKNER